MPISIRPQRRVAHLDKSSDLFFEMLFVGQEFFPVVEQIRGEPKTVRKIAALDCRHAAWDSCTAWRDRHPATDPRLPAHPSDTAVQFYTAGTTGLPKGAELINTSCRSRSTSSTSCHAIRREKS